jgi:hypothetical protein
MQRTICLTYEIQKIVEIDIPDNSFSIIEIENKIDSLFSENAPENCEILESDYSYFGCESPIPKGCGLTPDDDCWVNIDGQDWATNGWCAVTKKCPPVNDGNVLNPWIKASEVKEDLTTFVQTISPSQRKHSGYFYRRSLPLQEIGCAVYGDSPTSPGLCFFEDTLIAIVMPVRLSDKNANADELFKFN